MTDPTRRFSNQVENYIKYRPTYPEAILVVLKADCRLESTSIIADIGSGTGLLARLFLQNGNLVFGVEPNHEMREAGERLLREYPRFISIQGSAEGTGLADRSVDYVTAGQAFHWFDLGRARLEFQRILRPGGWVVLVWNVRRTASTPFLEDYEELLLSYGTDYDSSKHRQVDLGTIRSFFGSGTFKIKNFENKQIFDLEGLKGRLLSSSYAPLPGHPSYEAMLIRLGEIFEKHQVSGKVAFEYDTRLYYGQLEPSHPS